jgi:D-alanyl-D-alanine carboxypeptidase/D-alanyl-D-alanine-endopeptidase (penicillin-binding protein 4)
MPIFLRYKPTTLLLLGFYWACLSACGPQIKLTRIAKHTLWSDSLLNNAHIGISIYDAHQSRTIFRHQDNKLFIPASNVKLITMYESLKHLDDTLTAFQYYETQDSLFVMPTGDPTMLSSDFNNDPAFEFLKDAAKPIVFLQPKMLPQNYGRGWSINDRQQSYMPERNLLNVHKNLATIRISRENNVIRSNSFPSKLSVVKDTDLFDSTRSYIRRSENENKFYYFLHSNDSICEAEIPLISRDMETAVESLSSLLPRVSPQIQKKAVHQSFLEVKSQPRDSVLKFMMHQSDNFYAEQMLMMSGMKAFGTCDEAEYLEKLMNKDLRDLPQQARWVDGSGLSRYNLFSPADLVTVLSKINFEFGENKIKELLPTGGEGTLKNMMTADAEHLFAKSGSMSNVYCLSGMMIAAKGKKLFFSIMINSYMGNSKIMKQRIGDFLHLVRMSY